MRRLSVGTAGSSSRCPVPGPPWQKRGVTEGFQLETLMFPRRFLLFLLLVVFSMAVADRTDRSITATARYSTYFRYQENGGCCVCMESDLFEYV